MWSGVGVSRLGTAPCLRNVAMPEKVKIESLGVYLPEKVLTMEDLLRTCRHRPRLDLERITGIHERRVAENEFAADLAVQAARRALAMSRHRAADLDVLISTSISKHHRTDEFTLEPATAVLIRRAIGAQRALVFDVVNACAGMINGIWILQALIRSGAARTGMVVSGEHNMPLAWTAAREVRHSLDRQLAALTLGDCGAAVILDGSDDPRFGFHFLDLVTGAKHDHYCHSKPSPRGGGGVLETKARGLQIKGNQHFPAYLKHALDVTSWSLDDVHHLIPHQVSARAIRKGTQAVSRYLGCDVPDVVRCTAERYGNTTTTSHFVVLHDLILNGAIRTGENVLLVSGASGIVISHATLTLDDLPDRYRAHSSGGA
jgi:3-oxoacyl-[acyl-carrier-protein] synthase III